MTTKNILILGGVGLAAIVGYKLYLNSKKKTGKKSKQKPAVPKPEEFIKTPIDESTIRNELNMFRTPVDKSILLAERESMLRNELANFRNDLSSRINPELLAVEARVTIADAEAYKKYAEKVRLENAGAL